MGEGWNMTRIQLDGIAITIKGLVSPEGFLQPETFTKQAVGGLAPGNLNGDEQQAEYFHPAMLSQKSQPHLGPPPHF